MKSITNFFNRLFFGQALDQILERLATLDELGAQLRTKIDRIDTFSHGSRAVYVGNNRVLTKIVVADHQIAFLVEADDLLLSPWFVVAGGYETELTNYFVANLRPDSNCLDVGANFGYFTCLMARFCPLGRVIGIEPDRHVFELARDNLAINGFSQAKAIHAAANKNDSDVTLHRRVTRSGNTSISKPNPDFVRSMGEPESQSFVVKGIPLDYFLSEMQGRIDFIKIDVEGAEPLALEGARQIIESNPDIRLIMEWSPGQIAGAGFDVPKFLVFLGSLGLMPFDIQDSRPVPLTFSALMDIPYRAGILLTRGS